MTALITGAGSGIGREIARVLSEMGYNIIAVGRRRERLEQLENEIDTDVTIYSYDLSDRKQCFELFEKTKECDIDIVINNAGCGVFGKFCSTELDRELSMIDTNIKAVHILTKLFVQKFVSEGRGRILNVASSAGYMMGPFLSSYYASKAYVLRLSQAIDRELEREGSAVRVHTLCPGPVESEFDKAAGVKNSFSGLSCSYVAKYTVDKMLKGKSVIVPGFGMKLSLAATRFVPDNLLSLITYNVQKKKA